jgi:hypothetical protein
VSQHVHQPVDAEQLDAAADQIADSRLRHPEQLGSRGLRELAPFQNAPHLDHQLGSNPEILRLLRREPHVPEHVPR